MTMMINGLGAVASFLLILSRAVRSSAASGSDSDSDRGFIGSTAFAATLASSSQEWISIEEGLEFQPSQEFSNDPSLQNYQNQHLRKLWGRDQQRNSLKVTFEDIFVDGTETYYDENAQAWRLLGFYQDCDARGDDENNGECQRYLLWAAYIDQGYDSSTEYMYYDRHASSWNKDACNSHEGRTRCVKMDCHESTTHWKLLGIFKEAQYDAWLESLLQYQGDCVWNDDEYKFMQAASANGMPWPLECTAVEDTGLYYHLRPSAGGAMGVALYDDQQCHTLYTGEDVTLDDVLVPVASSSIDQELRSWNDALQAFTYCQPCKAHDLVTVLHKNTQVNAGGDRYGQADDDDANGGNNNNQDTFICKDATAENGNQVNQCMMFRQATNMQTASYRDVMLAESQGSVNGVHVGNKMLGEPYKKKHLWLSIILFLLSLGLLFLAFFRLYHEDRINSELKEPLVEQKGNKVSRSSNTQSNDASAANQQSSSDNTNKANQKTLNSSNSSRKSSKRSFWGRKNTIANTTLVAMVTLCLLLGNPVNASEDEIVGRLGTTLAKGSDTGCHMLQNKATATFALNATDLESNCVLVPGNAADLYRLVITGSAPDSYNFDLLEIEGKGYRTTPGSWGETSQGMEYCAPGGSMLYFDHSDATMEKEITISTTWLPENNDEYCCIDQTIAWSWGIPRCPSIVEAGDNEVCWSSPNYFLKASSFEYRVARPHPLPDTVVTWASRNIADNCASIQISDGAPFTEGPDDPTTQTIATTFTSSATGGERCLFLEVSKYPEKPEYWQISGAGVCDGRGGYEFFTPAQIGVDNVFIESCFEMEELRMVNIKGSSLSLVNLQMEVFLPWVDDEIGCDKTRYPSDVPSGVPSSLPSVEPSVAPSAEPSIKPSAEPSVEPSWEPTIMPSITPTLSPTFSPSEVPTAMPSIVPTEEPTDSPTLPPTIVTVGDGSGTVTVYEGADGSGTVYVGADGSGTVYVGADGTETVVDDERGEEMSTGKKSGKKDPEENEEGAEVEDNSDSDEDEDSSEDGNLVGLLRESQQSSGLTQEQLVGVLCGILLFLLLIVNCCFLRFYRRMSNGGRGRGNSGPGGNIPAEDPYGTVVTVEDLSEGKVLVKKVIPTQNGAGDVVQKTVYPSQAEAAKHLNGYDYL